MAGAAPQAATPAFSRLPAAMVHDVGPANAETPQTISIVLKARLTGLLASFIKATVDPNNYFFHRFLTTEQFADVFAPTPFEIGLITQTLQSYGITVDEVYANRLLIRATGTASQFGHAFNTQLRVVERNGKRYLRPSTKPTIPINLQDYVLSIQGLSTEPQFKPLHTRLPSFNPAVSARKASKALARAKANDTASGIPQVYTVGDVARIYKVKPLYRQGITGKNTTIGIATLADFWPSDAYNYWNAIGLDVASDRITQVRVDGGGPLSSSDGSGETTLDVQQSGGMAPDAKMVVYDAPNTDSGFTDVFYKAVSDNVVDTLSVSWGSAEAFYFNTDLSGGDFTSNLQAFSQVFMEAAAQGITMFAASGDAGAYELNRALPTSIINKVLTVGAPASDPYITAAGGTTRPVKLIFPLGTVTVPVERPWAWDYFNDYLVSNFGEQYRDYYFPVGAGGGVSVYWPVPDYQANTPGIRKSEPGQVIEAAPGSGVTLTPYTLPANFAGRNLPDLSLNADPETGYLVYSTEDGGWLTGYGGTSFVAPQLNGIAALYVQAKQSRIGFLNPQLYSIAASAQGKASPFPDITTGDNWFYQGVTGYDPATGLGTLNAAKLNALLPGSPQD